jgi:hypothetical protein
VRGFDLENNEPSSFNEFRVAAKFGFGQLDRRDRRTRSQSHEFAERNNSVANRSGFFRLKTP